MTNAERIKMTNAERIENGKKLTAPERTVLVDVADNVRDLMQCDAFKSKELKDAMKSVYDRGRFVEVFFPTQHKRAIEARKVGDYTEEVFLTSYEDQIIEVCISLLDLLEAKTISAVYWSAQELSENLYFVINTWSEKEDA